MDQLLNTMLKKIYGGKIINCMVALRAGREASKPSLLRRMLDE
jgi:hypothetical protein